MQLLHYGLQLTANNPGLTGATFHPKAMSRKNHEVVFQGHVQVILENFLFLLCNIFYVYIRQIYHLPGSLFIPVLSAHIGTRWRR